MHPEAWYSLFIVFLLLLAGFFFAGSETALTAASRARLLSLEKNGSQRAKIVNKLLDIREAMIGSLLVGTSIVNTAAAALTTGILLDIFGDVGIFYATIVISVLTIIFVEILPKTIAINYPESFSLAVGWPVRLVVLIFSPVTGLLGWLVRAILRLVGLEVGKHPSLLSATDELRGTVDLLHKEGSVEKTDRDMFGGLLDLQELTVDDVMVHRTKMFSVDLEEGPAQIVQSVLAAPYTRIPVWKESPENIIGVLHAKDLLRALDAAGNDPLKLDIEEIALPAWFVPDTTSLVDQLRSFRRRKQHFAFVVDEYGSVLGIVTLEDIIEEIVGDISDEHDLVVTGVRPQADGAVNVDGSVPIRDLNRAMDWTLPDEEATTIAGLVIHEARTIPEAGQTFTFHGYRFQVLRKQKNRIASLRITPIVPEAPDA
ncbi:HlyC/CorC family transporter [Labrys portucalensis]|uniref:HlyC/CorC family transporter n=1 Tax=Labrys neptuniae TaxID=376174 RepID=A0ABV6ZPC5_9HYPH|nr:HlyC/CorC family transporter [Labrys neptuniae]MDT3375911.1 HlyC/CorC family transporter [Labrys neptuniae]